MEAILNLIKCVECKSVLNTPVLLRCGHSICQEHVVNNKSEIKQYHCLDCDLDYAIPDEGFPRNVALETLLNANKSKIEAANVCPQLSNGCGIMQ
jgi:hypothetical protein